MKRREKTVSLSLGELGTGVVTCESSLQDLPQSTGSSQQKKGLVADRDQSDPAKGDLSSSPCSSGFQLLCFKNVNSKGCLQGCSEDEMR